MEPFASLDDVRIIPARAGKTDRSRRRLGLSTDHPRAGGENPDALLR